MTDDVSSSLITLYRIDLQQVQPLSEQEQNRLIEAVIQCRDKAAWNRLVEQHLGSAFRYIYKCCPPHEKYLLPDMLAEANLQLLQALDSFEPKDKQVASYLTAYLLLYVRGALYETIYQNRVIRIPPTTLREALQDGTIEQFNQMQPVSLDQVWPWEGDETIERTMYPLLSPEAAPESPPALRAQVEEWLSHLPASHETIVRMHYGLQAEDERCYTTREIAHLLGCTVSVVHHALKSARLRLRLLAEGSAQFRRLHRHELSQDAVKGTPEYRQRFEQEQKARIRQVYERRRAQGQPITLTELAQEAHVDPQAVRAFLRECGETYRQQRERASLERIKRVYEQWCAQGKRINMLQIANEAHASYRAVRAFVQECAQQRH